jgi:hypothetical protein
MTVTVDPLTKAYNLLKGLGKSGKQVAESLKEMGIKGVKEDVECPLRNFLKKKIKGTKFIIYGVGQYGVEQGGPHCTALPTACATFVSQFDGGKYPELEKRKKK